MVADCTNLTQRENQLATPAISEGSPISHTNSRLPPFRSEDALESGILGANTTRMHFAIKTFENPPMWPGMTYLACPLDQRVIEL